MTPHEKGGIFFSMKPTTDTLERFIRVSFEEIGELTNHEKGLRESIQLEGYSEQEWDELLAKHNVDD